MDAAKKIVSRGPGARSGELVFAGARVEVKTLVDHLKAGHPSTLIHIVNICAIFALDGRLVVMPQLHLYVPDVTAELLKRRAEERGMTLSGYLAEVVGREVNAEKWPEGFFEDVLGAWEGGIERSPQGLYEEREDLSNLSEDIG